MPQIRGSCLTSVSWSMRHTCSYGPCLPRRLEPRSGPHGHGCYGMALGCGRRRCRGDPPRGPPRCSWRRWRGGGGGHDVGVVATRSPPARPPSHGARAACRSWSSALPFAPARTPLRSPRLLRRGARMPGPDRGSCGGDLVETRPDCGASRRSGRGSQAGSSSEARGRGIDAGCVIGCGIDAGCVMDAGSTPGEASDRATPSFTRIVVSRAGEGRPRETRAPRERGSEGALAVSHGTGRG